MRPALPRYQNRTRVVQENYRPVILKNRNILNKILVNPIQQYIKRITQHNQVGVLPEMQRWLNICKSIGVTHHLNRMRKNGMIIVIDTGKLFDKMQYLVMIKTLNKLCIEKKCHLHDTSQILQSQKKHDIEWWKLKASKIRNKTGLPILATYIQQSTRKS